jgi:hypothetical protein
MKNVADVIASIYLILALVLCTTVVGSGKVGTIMGEELFVASASDMKIASVLLFISIPVAIYLVISLFKTVSECE